VSLLSVACLDYFFTKPVFHFYMSDSHDWVALATFESVALLVSRISNQLSRHASESEMHRSHIQKLYELSQNILLLDHQDPIDQQLAGLIQTTLQATGVALWNAYNLHLCMAGTAHQGRVWVNSDGHTGTTFFLTLPRMAKEKQTRGTE
jgi:two-component system sensor histidine kinase KdpD